jgi:hypothetical protein
MLSALLAGPALIPTLLAMLGVTSVGLGLAVWTGRTHRRKAHLGAVAASAVLFVSTVGVAEMLGCAYSFDPTALRVHLWFAHAATLALVATVVTGIYRLRRGTAVRAHRGSVYAFLALLVFAIGTGAHMLRTGSPRAVPLPEPHADTDGPHVSSALEQLPAPR